jgi:hypothetical protein
LLKDSQEIIEKLDAQQPKPYITRKGWHGLVVVAIYLPQAFAIRASRSSITPIADLSTFME